MPKNTQEPEGRLVTLGYKAKSAYKPDLTKFATGTLSKQFVSTEPSISSAERLKPLLDTIERFGAFVLFNSPVTAVVGLAHPDEYRPNRPGQDAVWILLHFCADTYTTIDLKHPALAPVEYQFDLFHLHPKLDPRDSTLNGQASLILEQAFNKIRAVYEVYPRGEKTFTYITPHPALGEPKPNTDFV